jgi:hypothetical protein
MYRKYLQKVKLAIFLFDFLILQIMHGRLLCSVKTFKLMVRIVLLCEAQP